MQGSQHKSRQGFSAGMQSRLMLEGEKKKRNKKKNHPGMMNPMGKKKVIPAAANREEKSKKKKKKSSYRNEKETCKTVHNGNTPSVLYSVWPERSE